MMEGRPDVETKVEPEEVEAIVGTKVETEVEAIVEPVMKLNDCYMKTIPLYQTECSNRNNLWAIYVVATFAAGGFVVTAQHDVGTLARIALTLGFAAFALGHAYLLGQSTKALIALEELLWHCGDETSQSFMARLSPGIKMHAPFTPHIVIDICVLLVIWIR